MIARVRPHLRPLRPLLPVAWRGIDVGVRLLAGARERLRSAAVTVLHRPAPPIRALDRLDLLALAASVPYYRPRGVYMRAAAREASRLIERDGLATALELGPNLRSLIVGADVMDIRLQPGIRAEGRLIEHNATLAPWPVGDKAYDLFVALQVFEHLGTGQAEAFREVRRVARHAILSLPIDWVMDDPRNCHHQLSEEKVLGWFAPVVPTRVLVGNPGRRKRLIYVFEDLPVPDAPA